MKKINSFIIICLLLLSLFLFAPSKAQPANAADHLSASQRSEYNRYINFVLPKPPPVTDLEISYYDYSYANYAQVAQLIGTSQGGYYVGIEGFLDKNRSILMPAEIDALEQKKQDAIAVIDFLDIREREIAGEIVLFYISATSVFYESATESDLDFLNNVLEEYETNFASDEVKMSYVLNSQIRVDSPYNDYPKSLLNGAVDHVQKCIDKIEIGKTYVATTAGFRAQIEALAPINETKSEDRQMLQSLRNEIKNYYDKAVIHIEELGFDKAQFEEDFSFYLWNIDRRLSKISQGSSSGIFWIVFLVMLAVGVSYMFSVGAFGINLKKKKRKIKQ